MLITLLINIVKLYTFQHFLKNYINLSITNIFIKHIKFYNYYSYKNSCPQLNISVDKVINIYT